MTLPPILGVSVHSQKPQSGLTSASLIPAPTLLGAAESLQTSPGRGEVRVQTGAGLHKDRAVLAEPADPGAERRLRVRCLSTPRREP